MIASGLLVVSVIAAGTGRVSWAMDSSYKKRRRRATRHGTRSAPKAKIDGSLAMTANFIRALPATLSNEPRIDLHTNSKSDYRGRISRGRIVIGNAWYLRGEFAATHVNQ